MMKSLWFLMCLAAAAALLSSCGSTEERVVAQIGDYEITVHKIKQEYLAISEHARPTLNTVEEKEAFVRDVVSKEVIRIEAEKAGFGELAAANEARDAALQNKAWQAYFEEEIRGKINITENEMRELYDRQDYAYHIAWVFTRSKGLAEKVLAGLEAGRSFDDMAELYSIDPSRSRGGDLGHRTFGNMPEDIEAKIASMSPGEVSGAMAYDGYYTVIKFIDKQPTEQMDFESSRVGLESTLMTKKITDLQKKLAEEYREKYNATYNDDVIELIAQRTREANRTETGPPGRLPRFSEDELSLVAASHDGAEWTVGRYAERIASMRDFGRPSYGADTEVVRSILRDYMTGELWVLEAMNLGYGERDDVVRAADREYEMVVVTAFHDSLVKDVTISEEDLRTFYDENKEQMMTDALYNFAIIAVETKPEAQEIYEELRAGANFATLARARSIDRRTRDNGGEILETFSGRSLTQFPDLYDIVYEMKAGEYTEPILVPPGWGSEGWMTLKLLKMEEPRQLEFDEIVTNLGPRVLELEQDRVFGSWLAERMEAVEVHINADVLASIDFSLL